MTAVDVEKHEKHEKPKHHKSGDTKEQILRVASHLLQTRGFSGFSYAHIAEALDVKPAAIHYHYPQKADLGLALIERYRSRYRRWMDETKDQELSPREALEGYIRIASRFSDDAKTCPMGILTAELTGLPDEMRAPVTQMTDEVLSWLTNILEAGRKDGSFLFARSADDLAALIASGLQGAVQLSRATKRPCFGAVVRGIKDALGLPS